MKDRNRHALCVGVYGSGSTWVFNVVGRLFRLFAEAGEVLSIFADEFSRGQEEQVRRAEFLVVKCHRPSATLRVMARLAAMPTILTIRDPRDAVASMMTRFEMTLPEALGAVKETCDAILLTRSDAAALLLRYEDGFINRPETIEAIARRLELSISEEQRDAIFAALTPDAVSEAIAGFKARGVFGDRRALLALEPETQWHLNHIGDRRVGKWREVVSEAEGAGIVHATRDYCAAFGYGEPAPLAVGAEIDFSSAGTGVSHLRDGFALAEPWGIWSEAERATLQLSMRRPIASALRLHMTCVLGPILQSDLQDCHARLSVSGRPVLELRSSSLNPFHMLVIIFLERDFVAGRRELDLEFQFDGLVSPRDLGLGLDRRVLGIGLVRMRIEAASAEAG
jgi:hypothetical protein